MIEYRYYFIRVDTGAATLLEWERLHGENLNYSVEKLGVCNRRYESVNRNKRQECFVCKGFVVPHVVTDNDKH